MVSEWERLMKVPKEELVIELIKARVCYKGLREEIDRENVWPWPEDLGGLGTDSPDKIPPEWAEKVALYGAMHPADKVFCWCDLENYGLDSDTAYEVCSKLFEEGRLKVPEGVTIQDLGDEQ